MPIGPIATDIYTKYEGDLRDSGTVSINPQSNHLEIQLNDGNPIEGAKVCLDRGNGNIFSAFTDENGRVIFKINYNIGTDKINVSKHNMIPCLE